jgi:hypothetical protein
VEEVQDEDRRSAGPSEQRVPAGEGDGYVTRHRGRPVPHGEEPRRSPHVRQVRGARISTPSQ